MDTSSSAHGAAASSSSSRSSNRWKYEVFLSFRGEDTRKNFTGHLFKALGNAGINTFMDNQLTRGENIQRELDRVIEGSRIAVIVFSKRYAESRWCLRELSKIMRCLKDQEGKIVCPIFYDVDPSQVRKQEDSFGEAFQKHEKDEDRNEVKRWREDLKASADLSGWNLENSADGCEWVFIEKIVGDVKGLLKTTDFKEAKHSVGMDFRVHKFSTEYLDVEGSSNVQMIGIWGMGGIGKTTLARAICNKYGHSFSSQCYLEDVRSKKKEMVSLQEQLLRDILKQPDIKISSVAEGTKEIKKRLGSMKVLVVVDDIDDADQLDELAIEHESFGPGSIIIITTRDEHVLNILKVDKKYEAQAMTEEEALKLLSWHAFGNDYPDKEYIKLARDIVDYCGGLPLALKVVGRLLNTKKSKTIWESTLDKLKNIPDGKIHETLKLSYDGLRDDHLKGVFLDISTFFIGWHKSCVMAVLDGCSGFSVEAQITTLCDRSLLYIGGDERLRMHDLIRDMGREIVRAKSLMKLGKRSRLWLNEDAISVLRNELGTEAVEGLVLVLPDDEESFSTKAFKKMWRLKFLRLKNVKLTGSYKHLSKELRLLCWIGFPLEAIPADFDQRNLVYLNLRNSKIVRVWEDSDLLPNKLKYLDLGGCHKLTELPDFSKLPHLEALDLSGCKGLCGGYHFLAQLKMIEVLNLSDCNITDGAVLEIIGSLSSLVYLELSGNGFNRLPIFSGLSQLQFLNLNHCTNLQAIPDLPNSLIELEANYCTALEIMSDFSEMSKMTCLELNDCRKLKDIPNFKNSLDNMDSIVSIEMERCTSLTDTFKENLRTKTCCGIILSGNDLPNWLAYVAREDETVKFEVPPSIDYIGGLAMGIVYSSDNSHSTGSLYIYVVNHTQRTYFRIGNLATRTASHEYYLSFGNLSNKKLNLKGGDRVLVKAKFYGLNNRIKVYKIGVDIVRWDLSGGLTNWDYEKLSYESHEDTDGDTQLSICHVFLCYKTPEAWPLRIEGSESDPLPKFFASALKARKNDVTVKTLLTVIEGCEGTESSDGDVLIFPQMIKYRGLKESDVDSFVDDVLVNHKPWASRVPELLTGSHVFVCAHCNRDERNRDNARVLIDKFKEEAELRGLTSQVFVTACYYTGGHNGNLTIYCPGSDGSITGHWYGYVTPNDVPELLDKHIGKGEIIERLWRGQMGASSDEAEKINDQKLPNGGEIHKKLKLRYDGLHDDHVKGVFLDISNFFIGWDLRVVMAILDGCSGFSVKAEMTTLCDRGLLYIEEEKLRMDDLIRDMGRKIVRAESPVECGKRSRLWHSEDAKSVLRNESGTEAVEALCLCSDDEQSFSTEAFKKMRRLKFLWLKNVKLTGSYKHLSKELRLLYWEGFPLEAIPADFDQRNLVSLNLMNSKIVRVWEDSELLPKKLKFLHLRDCHHLTELPDFSKLPHLETLNLSGCKGLCAVLEIIGSLSSLKSLSLGENGFNRLPILSGLSQLRFLYLNHCTNLQAIPELPNSLIKLEAKYCTALEIMSDFSKHPHLKILNLSGCKGLCGGYHFLAQLKMIKELNLSDCNITDAAVLEIIGSLSSLKSLSLGENGFNRLPILSGLSQLRFLYLNHCTNLQAIPELPNSLIELEANYCTALEIMSDFSKHPHLKILNLSGCKGLCGGYHFLAQLKMIEVLNLSDCNITDGAVLEIIGSLSSLKSLSLGENGFNRLPILSGLSQLRFLYLNHCTNLQAIPDLPNSLIELEANYCTALEIMSDFSEMSKMRKLQLKYCRKLKDIPNLENSMDYMDSIFMEGCTSLTDTFKGNLQTKNAFGGIFLSGNDIPNRLAYVAREDETVKFEVPPSIDYIGGLAFGIVYSSDNSDSTGSLYTDVVNHTQRTYFRIWNVATVTASHEYYLSFGNLSNKKLNLKGGDRVLVKAKFYGQDNRIKVKKTGVDIVRWDLSDGLTNWDNYEKLSYESDEDTDDDTQLSICHVFLCYKTPEAWPWRIEGSESDSLPKFFASALKARKNDVTVKTLLTVIEGCEGTESSDGDVLIFPQMIKYRGLKESDVDSFVDDVLVNHKPWASGVQEPLTGSHIFVCTHCSRDERNRDNARVLIDKFKEEAELRGLTNQVFVTACYYTGGHNGNLIIYCPGSDGSITGHWYGYVTRYDVPELLDQHIQKGEIIERLWRGQVGASSDEVEKINDQKLPNGGEIHKKLKLSYDRLRDDHVKGVFLDISNFFIGWNLSVVMAILDGCSRVSVEAEMTTLCDRGLLYIEEEKLTMDDLTRDMGREIVRAESPVECGKRSRLWRSEDAKSVLRNESGTEAVEGLNLEHSDDEQSFNTEAFKKMRRLKFLWLKNVKLTGSYKHLSKELRLLYWEGFPLEAIPADFDQRNLVYMNLSYSKIVRVWEDSELLPKKLKYLILEECHNLTELPDFSKLPHLEVLYVRGCKGLCGGYHFLADGAILEIIDALVLQDCNITDGTILEIIGSLSSLRLLDLGGNGFNRLPILSGLSQLRFLYLNRCTNLQAIRDLPNSLIKLEAKYCTALEIMSDFSKHPHLKILNLSGCKGLCGGYHFLAQLKMIEELYLNDCNITDGAVLEIIGSLSFLTALDLGGNGFNRLPILSGLSQLRFLYLNRCTNLQAIPDLPNSLIELEANYCTALEIMSDFSEMSKMRKLQLKDCRKLKDIPNLENSMDYMDSIHMEGCTSLTDTFKGNLQTKNAFGGIFLSGNDIPNRFAYVAREDETVKFEVPSSIDYIGGLALGIVYSSDISDSFGSLCIDVVNRTQRTYFSIWAMKATVTASHEYYLSFGNLSNKKLNLKGGDKVIVKAKFWGRDNRIKVKKTGVDIVKWDLSHRGTNWNDYVTWPCVMSYESDEDATESYTMSSEFDKDTNDDPLPKLSNHQVFLCYKTPEAWPWRIEGSESGPIPKFFASALKAHDITVKTLLTVIEGREGTEFSDGDVLIFPQMIKYRGQIGASSDEAEEINDRELPNGEENKKIEDKPQENSNQIHQEKGNQIENSENDESEEKQLKETRESCARKDALGKLLSLIGELLSCCCGWSSGNSGCGL